MRSFFFIKDKYLESLDIANKITEFINKFEDKYWEKIINEIFIIKYIDNEIIPVFYFCARTKCNDTYEVDKDKLEMIKQRKVEDFNLFIENVISKQCLINYEWVIAKEQMWYLIDAVFRMDDYYFWLNNTEHSFRELQEKHALSEEEFIDTVKTLYLGCKK